MRREKINSALCASVKSSMIIACAFLFFGCGGASSPVPVDGITPAQDIGELSSVEKLIYTDSYAGYLVVHISKEAKENDSSKLSLSVPSPNLLTTVPQLFGPVVAAHPAVLPKRSISVTEEEFTARRLYLERISGKALTDFNLIYHVEVSDPDEAVRVLRELEETDGVEKVYPKRKGYVATLATVPDLTGQQGYLYADETHGGLNAQAAWDRGTRGDGVIIVDSEYEWNYGHEDLNLQWTIDNWSAVGCYPIPDVSCLADMAHGTAIAGIISAANNGHGTTGFASNSDLKTKGPDPEGFPVLFDGIGSLDDSFNREVPPGTILVIETQHAGRLSPDGFCSGFSESDQYGCVPLETDPENFAAIEYATAAGALVIEGAGNGSVDLGDAATYYSHEVTLYDHDSGSILVGGSQGSNHQKISFSNFGTPVDSYAWAAGVVTTTYPYGDSSGPYYWTAGTGANPPNDDNNAYYTNRFGGTSSATAMVAGAAALVQSYAKGVMGDLRYLTPLKLREILVSTGIVQSGGGGYIGKQPRIDRALSAVDTFWSSVTSTYPELGTGGRLTVTEMIALRALGVGLVCVDYDPAHSDPSCPDDALFIPGTRIAKSLDFDGDNRADLVSWTNGQWKVDLSSIGSSGDNYGAWDLTLNYTPISSRWVWPYVEDYNSDGREDFAVYDKEHGIWYIAFTSSNLLGTGIWSGWDREIDYSSEWTDTLEMDPWDSNYSRPHPGDYNWDGWMDIAIACSDGYWRIDFGGEDESDYGTFDQSVQYLTPARMSEAPGWAYLTAISPPLSEGTEFILYKVPDGLVDEGRLNVTTRSLGVSNNSFESITTRFGGNETILVLGNFGTTSMFFDIGVKSSEKWQLSFESELFRTLEDVPPVQIYGNLNCRPIAADFDGDGIDDRAVMCPDEWKIAYSGSAYAKSSDGARHVIHTYKTSDFVLPGRSYSGGISYDLVQQLIAYARERNPSQPPPIPVDMVSTSVCALLHSEECR